MGLLAWGIALIAAVCLLQVPVTYWLGRFLELEGRSGEDAGVELPATTDAYDRAPGVCPRCGTHNDPTFAYCADCLAPLGGLFTSRM